MGIGASHPFARKPVDVWRLDLRRAVAAQVTIPEVVGQDDDDVGMPRQILGTD
jgi:hypothetical protein